MAESNLTLEMKMDVTHVADNTATRRRSDDFAWPGSAVWTPTEFMAVIVLSNEIGRLEIALLFLLSRRGQCHRLYRDAQLWSIPGSRALAGQILAEFCSFPYGSWEVPEVAYWVFFTIMSPPARGLRLTSTFRVSRRSPTNIKVSLKAAILYEKHPIKARNCFLWNLGIDLLNYLFFFCLSKTNVCKYFWRCTNFFC